MRTTGQPDSGLRHARNLTWRHLVIVVRNPTHIDQISNAEIRELVQPRINDLGGPAFDAAELGYFLIVESGDTLEAISEQMGFPILCNRITGIPWDQTGFTPSFEFVEEFPACFDLVFIYSDDGFGVELFVPRAEGVEPELLAMCQRYALRVTCQQNSKPTVLGWLCCFWTGEWWMSG